MPTHEKSIKNQRFGLSTIDFASLPDMVQSSNAQLLMLYILIQVLVMSIIPQDPLHPVDESILVVKDDVEDTKVDNLLKLIHANHCFSKSMFKGA